MPILLSIATGTMRKTAYLFLALPMLLRPVAAQTPDSYSYQILYTGRTLGYARIPDEQILSLKPPSNTDPNEIAKEFLDQFDIASKIARNAALPQFRIAMGDNFSPDLLGRSIRVDPSIHVPSCDGTPNGFYSSAIHLPKDYFNYDKGGWYIWCRNDKPKDELVHAPLTDNVAEFLIKAQYDTVVPGKHDFYFGPQYLCQIAYYLRNNDERRVQMLGENIIMTSALAPTPMNAHPRIPERLAQPCHWNTGKDHDCYHTDFGPASLDLPDNVLPWKRQFVLHGARRAYDKNGTLLRQDQLNLKKLKDADADYHPVFEQNSVQICAEPGPATASDPAKVLKLGDSCFPLVASDAICTPDAPPRLKSTCKAIYPDSAGIHDPAQQTASTDITFLFAKPSDHLIAGLNHMFCVKPSPDFPIFSDPSVQICQPFPVQVPMFWSNPEVDQPAPGMAACEQEPSIQCPYALVQGGKLKVAIFAVVDPDLLSNIGMLNTGWLNKNKKWDTVVQITAPDYALLQALDLCYVSDECRNAPKILMAQMSYARATQLISNSSFNGIFDVVITQASPEHDTGNIENRYQGKMPRFVLTPPQPISPDLSFFTPQVYVATITKEKPPQVAPADAQVATSVASRQTCQASPPKPTTQQPGITTLPSSPQPHDFDPCWSLRNTTARSDISGSQPVHSPQMDLTKIPTRPRRPACPGNETIQKCRNLERLAKQYLARQNVDKTAQAYPLTNPAASDPLFQAVLVAMRNTLKTDAAIIQTRDLYDPDNQSYEEIKTAETQDQISRVIWKGDEVIVLHVTGATIRKLLKQSATFAQLDKNLLNTEIETGRDLVTLGIYPDPKDSDTYYINGAVMSDTALYSIAATDFISGGDTGYANLVPPDVLPAFRIRDFAHKEVRPISGLVCKEIASPNPHDAASLCADMQLRPDYFDASHQAPSDATPGFSTSQQWRAFPRIFIMPRRPFLYSEEAVQQRPFLSLKLENLDFSESGVFINDLSETAVNLAGISNPLITHNNSLSIGADHKARLVYDYQRGTAYLLSDSSFLYNATTSGPPAFTNNVSLANNVLGSEVGGTFRLPVSRNRTGLRADTPKRVERPSWLSFQYSIRYEQQLIEPPGTQVLITPTPPPGSVSTITLQTPKINTIYGRAGLRVESSDNYLESGLEEIDSRGVLQGYALPQSSGPTYYCFPSVSSANLLCGTNPSPNSTADTQPITNLMLAGNSTLTVSPQTTAYITPGAYLNLYWKFPIWSRRDANRADQSLYFTLTNKGDIYFNTSNDTAVQTRYLDKLTPALNFPIWAGLSLTPKVDLILYENKINYFHYRAVQPSVALSYTFNWREGMSWTRALRYGAQTTTPSPAGSTH